MSALASFSLAFGGMALTGLSMDRHARQAAFAIRARWLRPAGWLLIALSLVATLGAPNWRFALVEWIGLLGAAAGLVVLTLHYRARTLPAFALIGSALGLAAWLAARLT